MLELVARLQERAEALRAQILRLEENFEIGSQVQRLEDLIDVVQRALKSEVYDKNAPGGFRPALVSVVLPKGGISAGVTVIAEDPNNFKGVEYFRALRLAQIGAGRTLTGDQFIDVCDRLIERVKSGTWSFQNR